MKTPVSLAIASLVSVALAVPAAAAYTVPHGRTLSYQVEITPHFMGGVPWTGALALRVGSDNLISGQYRSTSAKPDPFYGKIVQVHGAISAGDRIRLDFNVQGTYQARGTISATGIRGSFYDPRRRLYDFTAQRVFVHPH